jgi:hypothetical protein
MANQSFSSNKLNQHQLDTESILLESGFTFFLFGERREKQICF